MHKDFINHKFFNITVVKNLGIIKGKTRYLCNCICGNTTILSYTNLNKGITKSCGCLKKSFFRNLIGLSANSLTLNKYTGKNKYNCHMYEASCVCGKTITVEGNDVMSGRIKSCGCLKTKNAIDKCNNDPYHTLFYNLFSDYRLKAGYRRLEFNLSFDEFKNLVKKPCIYCGIPSSNIKKRFKNNKVANNVILHYNGLDRKNNKIGYTNDNSAPCCKICNQAKHTMTQNEFYNWVERLYNNLQKKQDKAF